MEIHFLGGASTVTGSQFLLVTSGARILVDCGMIQGSRYNDEMNYQAFAYDPKEIDYLFITHSHVDHMARAPKLFHDGFRGVIYASEPTAAIIAAALPDTLNRIISDAREYNLPPLWDATDMENTFGLFRGVPYGHTLKLNDM